MREKELKEAELRDLAVRARMERAGTGAAPAAVPVAARGEGCAEVALIDRFDSPIYLYRFIDSRIRGGNAAVHVGTGLSFNIGTAAGGHS